MAQRFEVRDGATSVGSFSGDEIRQLAADGTLNAGMQIRRLPNGAWSPLSSVQGLQFKSQPAMPATVTPPLPPAPQAAILATPVTDIECPYCSELIKATAKKCKHCGEFLDGSLRGPISSSTSSPKSTAAERDCPTCGERIKATAKKCPFCGEMLVPTATSVPTDDSDRSGLPGWRRILVGAVVCYILFGMIVGVCYLVLDSTAGGWKEGSSARAIYASIFMLAACGEVVAWIVGSIACYQVAAKVYDPGLAVVLAVVTLLFACFGWVILLAVNAKAVSVLRRSGYGH